MYKRKASFDVDPCLTEKSCKMRVNYRTVSDEEEHLQRMRAEYHRMSSSLDSARKENVDIIDQAGREITRLRTEKESVIKQSVQEITRVRRELGECNESRERIESRVKQQDVLIEFLRTQLSIAEAQSAPKSKVMNNKMFNRSDKSKLRDAIGDISVEILNLREFVKEGIESSERDVSDLSSDVREGNDRLGEILVRLNSISNDIKELKKPWYSRIVCW